MNLGERHFEMNPTVHTAYQLPPDFVAPKRVEYYRRNGNVFTFNKDKKYPVPGLEERTSEADIAFESITGPAGMQVATINYGVDQIVAERGRVDVFSTSDSRSDEQVADKFDKFLQEALQLTKEG